MKFYNTIFICLLLLFSGFWNSSETYASSDKEQSSSGSWIVTAGSVIALGVGGYILVKNIRARAAYRDSLINAVETEFINAEKSFSQEQYSDAIQSFSNVLQNWQEYVECKREAELPQGMDSASIQTAISESRFFIQYQDSIAHIKERALDLPQTEEQLVEQNRHEVIRKKDALKDEIQSIQDQNPQFDHLIVEALAPAMKAVEKIDTMFVSVYNQQQINFDVKTRFFYNMAMQSDDTTKIREFVIDCEYYQIEKNWCERAKLALGEAPSDTLSSLDSAQAEFKQAMDSRLIEKLNAFIEKYSQKDNKKYEEYINSASEKIEQLKKEMELELAYSRQHPFFVNADLSLLDLSFNNVSQEVQESVENYITRNSGELRNIAHVRFPAEISFDLSGNDPTLIFTGFVSCQRDLLFDTASASESVSLPGAVPAMEFLAQMYTSVTQTLDNTMPPSAVTIVRFRKSMNDYITYYARYDGEELKWYDFFDLTLGDKQNVRISEQAIPQILISTDELVPQFFEIDR